MFKIRNWKSTTAVIIALGMSASAIAPILIASPASAQYRDSVAQRRDYRIPAGTAIQVRYDAAEKIVVSPNETTNLTLTVDSDVVSRDGEILIPARSQVVGELRPARGGSQFVARELILPGGERRSINASSQVITETQEIRRGTNLTSLLTGAAIGSAAGALIAGITGDRRIDALEVLAGTGTGTLGGLLLGGRRSNEVVVIDPNSDLDLRLNSDLVVNSFGRAPGYSSGYSNPGYNNNPNYNPGSNRGI
ncbi:hypothetical protein NIES2119_17205 [[Phormidium ambiguum] IAM M-71]|uniref:Uncharacterized protein n=1 Tax=[Phormidium ambiguum] IAM M-71 TaxID=454136 RepID=A0A1U7IH82_9CYAN|nr:hypothetical protein [Phormidium ambiguum]OKH36384.1 hypothetical protein NIES2119_17205 [Phormidium ambiguum IAM M-71]